MSVPTSAPLPPPDPSLARSLVADLRAAEFTGVAVEDALGELASRALHRDLDIAALARLDAGEVPQPLATLIGFFLLGRAVPLPDLAAALPATTPAGLAALGLVVPSATAAGSATPGSSSAARLVRATCELRPYQTQDDEGEVGWYLASDFGARPGLALPPDHVPGVGGASLALASLAVRGHVETVLDLGTGNGVQALHATRHASRVVATDTSVRALGYARLSAALAGVELDLRQGDLFEPVAGQRFDRIVSNPPFVITPPDAGEGYEYRFGGRPGDALMAELLAGLPAHLAPGGIAQMLGNWEHHAGVSWRERVEAWMPRDLDYWVVQREVLDPAEYAEMWLRDGGLAPADPAYEPAYRHYLADFAARGVEAIGMGFITVRRPIGARSLRRIEQATGAVQPGLGDHIAACLAAHDWLAERPDDGLLAARLERASDLTDERYFEPGATDPRVILLRQGGGFSRVFQPRTASLALVGACDGELPLGVLVEAIAALVQRDSGEVWAEIRDEVREFVATGVLRPAMGS